MYAVIFLLFMKLFCAAYKIIREERAVKKLSKAIISIAVSASILLAAGCTSPKGEKLVDETYAAQTNLADKNSRFYDSEDKEKKSFSLKGKEDKDNFITVDLGETKTFNTVLLREKGKNVTLFAIYGSNEYDKNYEFIYQSDTVECGHPCYLGETSYRYLRIFVINSSGNYHLTDLAVYNMPKTDTENFRRTAYLVSSTIREDTDFSFLNGVTDIIYFGMAKFTKDGDIMFEGADGLTNDDSTYVKNLEMLRKAIGDRDIDIVVDIHLPYGNGVNDVDLIMNENLENTVKNIKAFVDKYSFDGYDIDYEYPTNFSQWKHYNNFLRELDKAMPDKIISIATSPWALKFDKDVIELIDRVELMLYDGFDTHGYHSTIPYTIDGTQKLLSVGFSKEQIDIGVPFYSRPINAIEFWGNYTDHYEEMGRFNNLVYDNTFDHSGEPLVSPQYFNSVQIISDKAAFAIDAGLGGMMIWHATADLPFDNESSLFKSISDTVDSKTK